MGLINEVVNITDLIARATQILTGIMAMAPIAVESVLTVIDHGYDMSLADALHLEAVHFAKVCASVDKTEGVAAFLEKRLAHFKAS